jgi:flagellar motor protein MotB
MALARQNKPGASLAALHKECRRIDLATKLSARAGFDHGLTVVNSMLLQNSEDLFEPDAAAVLAIEAFRPGASVSTAADKGGLLQAEVRRQLALYHKELLAVSRTRRNTMAVAANLDSGGLDVKQARGRLPENPSLLTSMVANLWQQVYQPLLVKVIEPWLQMQKLESNPQAYLKIKSVDGFAAFAEKQGLTHEDIGNLRTLLQLELSFLKSQVWLGSLVSEFKVVEHQGRRLYEFKVSRSFKTAGKAAHGSLPAATRWPLTEKASALVHTLLHLTSGSDRLFPGRSLRAVSEAAARTFARLGWNWCGIPRLGPHVMRTYRCCQAVNDPGVTAPDYPALATMMQVTVDTMTGVYVAQSLQGPAAQLALRLHASEEKEHTAHVSEPEQDNTQQKKEREQQKKQKLEEQKQQQQRQAQRQQQQDYAQQQQQYLQQVQQQQYMQQQQHMQQQQYLQQQQYMYPSPWMPPLFTAPAVPVPASAPAAASAPYGRALSTLRHKHDAAIQYYFASRGFCVDDPPGAARVATVFKELCVLRGSSALPEEAIWFDFSATWFDDKHEKPFRDYIRKLFNSKKGTTE